MLDCIKTDGHDVEFILYTLRRKMLLYSMLEIHSTELRNESYFLVINPHFEWWIIWSLIVDYILKLRSYFSFSLSAYFCTSIILYLYKFIFNASQLSFTVLFYMNMIYDRSKTFLFLFLFFSPFSYFIILLSFLNISLI